MTEEIKKQEREIEDLLPLELENIIQEQEIISDERSIDQIVSDLERGVEAYNRIKQIALRLTNSQDWVSMNGQPFLMEKGAQKIARAFGVFIFKPVIEYLWQEDNKGKYQIVIAHGKAFSRKLGSYVEDIGTCSQRDKFFAIKDGELRPIEEIDFPNIIKKAVANLYGRLIKRVIGLMGITWDDLKAVGIEVTQEVKYKEKKPLSPEAQKIGAMILEMAGGDKEAAKSMLRSLSEFEKNGQKYSVSSVADLSEAWAKKLLPKVEKEYNEWRKMGSEVEDDKS
jgi:hypothetical protein